MKKIIFAAAIALSLIGSANAQTTVTSGSASGAAAVLNQYNVIPGTNGSNVGGGGIGNGTWVMGQTTGGNSSVSYDACLKNANLTVLFAAVNVPLEISHCWALRSMDAMAKFPPGSIQYEYGCQDSTWAKVDWDTGTMACTANKAKLARQTPSDPRAQKMAYVPVVQAGHGANTQGIVQAMAQPVPPTVVPVAATTAPAMMPATPQTAQAPPSYGTFRECLAAVGIPRSDVCQGLPNL